MKLLTIISTIFLVSCSTSQVLVEHPVNPFVGKWKVISYSVDLPELCRTSAFVQFNSNGTMVTKTGHMWIEESYSYIELKPNTFQVTTSNQKISGLSNCTGNTVEFVKQNFNSTPSEYLIKEDKIVQNITFSNNSVLSVLMEKVE